MSPWMNCSASRFPRRGRGPARRAGRGHVGRWPPFAWRGDVPRTELVLGDRGGLALAPEQAVGRDAYVLVMDEGVHALVLRTAGQTDVPGHVDPGGLAVGTRNMDAPLETCPRRGR